MCPFTQMLIFYVKFCDHDKGPSGRNLADSAGNPRGLWLLMEKIHADSWVVSETRILVEIQGKFLNRG